MSNDYMGRNGSEGRPQGPDPLRTIGKALLDISARIVVGLTLLGIPAAASFTFHLWNSVGELTSRVDYQLRPIEGNQINDVLREVLLDHNHCGTKWHKLNEDFHLLEKRFNESMVSLGGTIGGVNEQIRTDMHQSLEMTRQQITVLGEGLVNLRHAFELHRQGMEHNGR